MNKEFVQLVTGVEMAKLLFAIEAALPYVRSAVGKLSCSSAGGPVALEQILRRYNWDRERWHWLEVGLAERDDNPPGWFIHEVRKMRETREAASDDRLSEL